MTTVSQAGSYPSDRRYLKRLDLSNVRTFRSSASLDFCLPSGKVAQWTVILGENGTGKTSLLQYLAGMVPIQESDIPATKKDTDTPIPPPFRPLLGGSAWIGWHAGNLSRPWKTPSKLSVTVELTGPTEGLKSRPKKAKEEPPLFLEITFDENENRRPVVTTSFTINSDLRFYDQFKIFAYGASRHVAGPASPYLSSDSFLQDDRNSPSRTLFHDDLPLISPEQWLLSLDHISRSGESKAAAIAKRNLANARRCLASVLPGISKIDVKPYSSLGTRTTMAVICQTSFGPVPFGSLSLGYRTMAAWLTDFLKRMHEDHTSLEQPQTGPAIVLIDEFDLHMHPAWQREVMTSLSREFPNTQFVITAHSPLIVQATEGHAKLAVLRKVPLPDGSEEVIIDSDPDFVTGWRVDQILASDLYGMNPRSKKYSNLLHKRIKLRQKEKLSLKEKSQLAKLEEDLDKNAPPSLNASSAELLKELRKALLTGEPRLSK